jgi:hypothetical protein
LFGPLPPQKSPVAHEPQLSVPPQPFGADPQLNPSAAQVVGVHTHWLPVHTSGDAQSPQFT